MNNKNDIEIPLLSKKELFDSNNNFSLLFTNIEESKILLKSYENFINKYFVSINSYFKQLTEFNFNFLSEQSFKSSITKSPIFQLGKAIKKAVQAQIDNLYSIITNQKIFFAFSEALTNLSKILQQSPVKLGKTSSNAHIRPVVISLMESFADIESKVIDEYISKKYNKNVLGLNKEPLKDIILKADFLEKTFLVFEEGTKNQLLNDFQDMEKKTTEIFNEMKDIVKNIVDILKENNNAYLDKLQNEIDLIGEIPISESSKNLIKINKKDEKNKKQSEIILNNDDNIDMFKYRIKIIKNPKIQVIDKKENNNKIENNDKIDDKNIIEINENNSKIDNNIINKDKINNVIKEEDKETDIQQKDIDYKLEDQKDILNNKELILTDEDIYNIVSTLYGYNFKMINKSEYNLDIEKGKVKVFKLTEKLLTFDGENNINEEITDEEVNNLYELLNNRENLMKFFLMLNNYRATGRYEATERALNIIINIFNKGQDYLLINREISLEGMIIILSQTFYIMKDGNKFFIQKAIKDHPLFKKEEFWENYLKDGLDEEIEKVKKNEKHESEKNLQIKVNEVMLSKVIPISSYMRDFGLNDEKIINIVNNIFNRYEINEEGRNMILSLLEKKV